ncbi:hypothetical protein [Bacillus testis]|uniref:hypothetical protein n=1 Tax=Bacillus testis TaxID=1622072 RepID=UPI00067EB856|nr:hypothetical protein [Bacillus testis]
MLKEQVKAYIKKAEEHNRECIVLYEEEKRYAAEHGLIPEGLAVKEGKQDERFASAYLERGDKETENFISEETSDFLNQPISYFKEHKEEFLYAESSWFDCIGIDGLSFEEDDVFKTYNVMTGLKLPKKCHSSITQFLDSSLKGEIPLYSLMFSQNDGLWELNFTLDYVDGFREEMNIREAFELIYGFLFTLGKTVEGNQ